MRIEWHFIPPFRQVGAGGAQGHLRAASVEKRLPKPHVGGGALALPAMLA